MRLLALLFMLFAGVAQAQTAVPSFSQSTSTGAVSVKDRAGAFNQFFPIPSASITASMLGTGVAAANVGALTGACAGSTLPNCTIVNGYVTSAMIASGAAATNIGTLTGACAGSTLPNCTIPSGYVAAPMLASGAAVGNIGYTPLNKAGDTMLPTALPTLYIGSQPEWLGTNPYAGNGYAYGYSSILTIESRSGGFQAATFATRASDNAGHDSFSALQMCFNDTGTYTNIWCNYGDARRYNISGVGSVQNAEWNTVEFGTASQYDPFSRAFGGGFYSAGIRLLSGGACISATPCLDPIAHTYTAIAQPASVAISIANNGSTYLMGISFDAQGLQGTDGKTLGVFSQMIEASPGQSMEWQTCTNTTSYPNNCAIGNVSSRITSQQTSASPFEGLYFTNAGLQLENILGVSELNVVVNATDTDGVVIQGSSSTKTVLIGAAGSSTDLNTGIFSKGAGKIVLQNPVNANALATGTPAASVCLDSAGNLIKKTTTGACV